MKLFYFSFQLLFFPLLIKSSTSSYVHHASHLPRLNASEFVYKSNQDSIVCSPSTSIQIPKSVEEVQKIVEGAIESGQTVKVIGTRHSTSDLICTDGIPISMETINYAIDNGDGTATFGAGLKLTEIFLFLEQRNLSLIQASNYGGVTIGGAISTDTHGSSMLHPTSFSDQVVALTVIDGTGKIQKITTPHLLKAFRVHLGLLGIIVDVTLATVPLFKITLTIEVHPESVFFNGEALNWAETFDSLRLIWFPSTKEVLAYKGVFLNNTSTPGNASFIAVNLTPEEINHSRLTSETLHFLHATQILIAQEESGEQARHSNIGRTPSYSEDGVNLANPATGFGWRLFSNECTECAWDNGNQSRFTISYSFAVATSELGPAIQTIKNILKEQPAPFPEGGIGVRFSKASDALMSVATGRTTAHLEWDSFIRVDPFQTAKVGLAAYQAISQALVKEHNARPHWAKGALHYYTDEVFKTSAPNRPKFIKIMKKFDPNGIFLNKFGRRFLGKSHEMDMDPRVTHCAIQDYCICAKDDDCAPLQICSSILGYSVCKDSWEPPSVDVIKSVVQALPA